MKNTQSFLPVFILACDVVFKELSVQNIMVVLIAILTVTSPVVINVPTRGLLAVETKNSFVVWLANLNIKRIVYKQ